MFKRRLLYWDLGSCSTLSADFVTDTITKRVRQMFESLHYNIGMASIRTLCNAWNTSSRFHSEARRCCYCGAADQDSIKHLAVCTVLTRFSDNAMDEPLLLTDRDAIAFFIGAPPFVEDACVLTHGILVTAFLMAHQLLAGVPFNSFENSIEMVSACLRALSRKDPRVRRIVAMWRPLSMPPIEPPVVIE